MAATNGSGGSAPEQAATGSTSEVASYLNNFIGYYHSASTTAAVGTTLTRVVPVPTPNSITVSVVIGNDRELAGSAPGEILSYLQDIANELPGGSIQRANIQTIMDTIEAMNLELVELRGDTGD
jgi:hypothetical protein